MWTNPRVFFLGSMGRRSLVVSKGRKVIFLVLWDGVVGKRGWVFFSLFFFCDMVT
jgi:hypothetical protein